MRAAQIRRHLGAPSAQLPRTGTEQGLPSTTPLLLRGTVTPSAAAKAAKT